MISNKTIFFSSLDWGFGHATRSVPIIKSLSQNNKIILGITYKNKLFFDFYFPELLKIELPSYNISYSKILPVWLKILIQWPKIKSVIKLENRLLKNIVSDYKIDLIISDNRFGLFNENIQSVFITHQLKLKVPFFVSIINKINAKYIHHFNEIWVPDYENKELRLSGQLSDSNDIKIPVKYIGPQSLLIDFKNQITNNNNKIDYLILLSGVEPQRSMLEKKLIKKLSHKNFKVVLVRGSEADLKVDSNNINVINFAYGAELTTLINTADTIVCRSGYSSLMDLHLLRKEKIILIPTPGQSEQEYLAHYWKEKFETIVVGQNKIETFNFEKQSFD